MFTSFISPRQKVIPHEEVFGLGPNIIHTKYHSCQWVEVIELEQQIPIDIRNYPNISMRFSVLGNIFGGPTTFSSGVWMSRALQYPKVEVPTTNLRDKFTNLPCLTHSQWDFQGPPMMGPPYGKLPILFP